ncbi:MAG: cytochrome c oxidase subunit 3 family protein [Bdellovibrionales bacterium]|nr:cytochrome c oxidase subunit 3 family protein [Bdellovibrionales bacterium]
MSIAKEGEVHHFAHHFDDADHEYESTKQGVWLFMVTEVLMFGALLVGYLIFKGLYPEVFEQGGDTLNWKLGATNTVVLIFSSLTMALGIYYIRIDDRKKALLNLGITLICGFIFLGIKYIEYSHKFHLGIFPGKYFHAEGFMPDAPLYFSFYYMLTGLHGLHVVIGMGLIAWIMIRVARGTYSSSYWTGVEGVGIFWHLVDLVWIYLFPLLYLVG